jgi:hypothetical protein
MSKAFPILLPALVVCCALAAGADEADTDEVKKSVKSVFDYCFGMQKKDFTVTLKSKEMKDLVLKHTSGKLPAELQDSELVMINKDGKVTFKIEFRSMPAPFRKELELMTKPLVQSTVFGQIMDKMNNKFFHAAFKLLMEEESFDVIQKTDKLLDVEVNDMDEPFVYDTKIKSARLKLDLEKRIVNYVRLYIEGEKEISMKADYSPVEVPGMEKKALLPSKVHFKQNMFLEKAGMTLPREFDVTFHDYKFAKPEPEKPAAPETP